MSWWFVMVAWLVGGTAFAGDYAVGAGDTLHVEVYGEPDLTADVVVGDACTVTLGLVGPVEVCGRTVEELGEQLTAAYGGDYLVSPQITVKVADYRSQRVDVLGEVEKRGPIYLRGRTTLVEVLSMAGGPRAENVAEVELIRGDGESATYDLKTLTQAADTVLVRAGDKVILKPGQVVYLEGEVVRPGTVTLSDGLTVTEALARAGGADEYANLRRVMVRRADGSQVKVNVHRVHKGSDDDVALQPDDHVLVPRTPL